MTAGVSHSCTLYFLHRLLCPSLQPSDCSVHGEWDGVSIFGRKSPSRVQLGNVRLQYIQDIQVNSLNGAFAAEVAAQVRQYMLATLARNSRSDLHSLRHKAGKLDSPSAQTPWAALI